MASYTIELRDVIQLYGRETVEGWFKDYDLKEFLTDDQISVIEEYGVWTKNVLAKRIVDHYFMREIGFETPALFRHYVKTTLNEIMEEKLPLIYTASIDYDLLVNEDYTETFTRAENSTSSSNSQATGSGLDVSSDTPQGQINKSEILQGKYASSTGATENTSNGSSTAEAENNEEYTRRVKGNHGISATYQAMIKQYRDNIMAINRDIIDELDELFMGLF